MLYHFRYVPLPRSSIQFLFAKRMKIRAGSGITKTTHRCKSDKPARFLLLFETFSFQKKGQYNCFERGSLPSK